MLSNSEQEEIWVNGWNDLYDLIPKYPNGFILINDYEEVTVEEAQGWMQDAAYNSNKIIFTTEYYKGKKSILLKQESI